MRGRSIRFRLTVWYGAILTAALAVFGGLVWVTLRQQLVSELDSDLDGRAARFETYFRTEFALSSSAQLRDELEEFCHALPPPSFVNLRGTSGCSCWGA